MKCYVFDKNIGLPVSSVKLATATKPFLSWEGISASEKSNFWQDCIILLSRMISKLQERSPLKYQIVCCMSCIVPTNLNNKKDEYILKFSSQKPKVFTEIRSFAVYGKWWYLSLHFHTVKVKLNVVLASRKVS